MKPKLLEVFRAYDIRGLSPDLLDAAFAERLGRVISDVFHPTHVMVGRDMRETSPMLEQALIKGLTEQGVNVTRIGLCSTPLFNIAIGLAKGAYDLGVMVTASHNPSAYNGFKLTDGNVYPIGQGTGMELIRDRFASDEPFLPAKSKGVVHEESNALSAYLDHIFSIFDHSSILPMKVAIDAGNGMAGYILPELEKRLPQVEFVPLYWELDGHFPHHEANPLKGETLSMLSKVVRDEKCICGVAYDGDCDRIGFVDEHGDVISGDLLTAILGCELLRRSPNALMLYDVRCSWATGEAIRAAGGRTEMTRVGHAFIKRQLRESGAFFAGELSMHFYFSDLWGVESGDYAFLLMLALLSKRGKTLSSMWRPLARYPRTEEINSEVADTDVAMKRVRDRFEQEATSSTSLDGLRMDFGIREDGSKSDSAWWFSLRASNTEPLLRLIVEAVQDSVLHEKRDELLGLIRGA